LIASGTGYGISKVHTDNNKAMIGRYGESVT
jgi:hypothetical protein